MRGGMSPAFQAYNCGEPICDIATSDDELNLVFAFGKNSNSLYCWKFQASLEKSSASSNTLHEDLLSIKQQQQQQEKVIFTSLSSASSPPNIRLSTSQSTGVRCNTSPSSQRQAVLPSDIRGVYQDMEEKLTNGFD